MHREGKPSAFPDTRWSLIGRAAALDDAARAEALAELLPLYLPGLRTFLLAARRVPAEQVDDLLQAFVTDKILVAGVLRHADGARGRFRSFVVKTLSNYASSWLRREGTARLAAVTLDAVEGTLVAPQQVQAFDRAWTTQLVHQALEIMQADCAASGRTDLWEMFRARVAAPLLEDAEPEPYAELVERLGLQTPRQAINLLATAKRAYARALRCAVQRYVTDEAEVEAELAALRASLGGVDP